MASGGISTCFEIALASYIIYYLSYFDLRRTAVFFLLEMQSSSIMEIRLKAKGNRDDLIMLLQQKWPKLVINLW